MKKIISLLMVLCLVLCFAGCAANDGEGAGSAPESVDVSDVKCNVYALSGPTGMGLAPLMRAADSNQGKLDYSVNIVAANDEIVAKIVKGEADIAAVATNLASTLYKKTNGGISVLAVNTLGTLCVVAKGEQVTDIASLKGKTIYTTGQGANPEYISKFILSENGLEVGKDVTLEFVAEPAELVTKVVSSEKAIVIAPQPVATTITVKDAAAKVAIDLNDEWDKVSDSGLYMGCIIARNEYIKENPDAIKAFLADYEESINTVNNDIDTSAQLCVDYGIIAAAPIAKKAIPYCNIVCIKGEQMKKDLASYLDFLFKANPKSVGGAVPADDFYYEEK